MSFSVLQAAQGMTKSIKTLSQAMLISNNIPHTQFQNFPQQIHFPTYQQYHNANTLKQDSLVQQMASASSPVPKPYSNNLDHQESEKHHQI